jgi:AraC family transcriptional regulator
MQADIHTLFQSDFYRILDFRCRCTECTTSKPEYSDTFGISFVRKGNFLFNVFRHTLDSYNGCVLITKPGYERTVTHAHAVPDQCTIFEFRKDFFTLIAEHYQHCRFFHDADWHSTLIRTNASTELLHYMVWQLVYSRKGSKLQIDNMVLEIMDKVLGEVTDYHPDPAINSKMKKNHLLTIERAKEYITNNFTSDISLMELATYCYVSPFHFSRIFKTFTKVPPHQYLADTRLQHAALMLRTTGLPVADIAFNSGFNSIEYFNGAFKKKYNCTPGIFRNQQFSFPVISKIS